MTRAPAATAYSVAIRADPTGRTADQHRVTGLRTPIASLASTALVLAGPSAPATDVKPVENTGDVDLLADRYELIESAIARGTASSQRQTPSHGAGIGDALTDRRDDAGGEVTQVMMSC
jgi:hypothetical protein